MTNIKNIDFSQCYENRFSQRERKRKYIMWKKLCDIFLQQFVGKNDTVMDMGSGYCEFINNIKCAKKIAVDVNPDMKEFADKNVEVINKNIFDLPKKFKNSIDVIFLSNFLEHLNTKEEVLSVLSTANKLLKKKGKMILLQPNIDLVKESYWDFIDHKVVLNTRSIKEVMDLSGFRIKLFIRKFLPYTTKMPYLPMSKNLIKFYLSIPQIIRPFAGQSFLVAVKR